MTLREKIFNKIDLHASYVRVFSTPDGQRVLRHILKEGMALKPTHIAGDPYTSALNEGKRVLALSIAKFALRDHNKMIEMIEKGLTDE